MIEFLMFNVSFSVNLLWNVYHYQIFQLPNINDIFFYIIADYIGGDLHQVTEWVVFLQCFIFIFPSCN